MASGVIPEDVAAASQQADTSRRRKSRSSISKEDSSRDVTIEGVEPGHGGEEVAATAIEYQLPPIPAGIKELSSNVRYKGMPTSPTIGGALSRVPTPRQRAVPLSAPDASENVPLENGKEVQVFRLANGHRNRAATLGRNS